jgi:hypothetical protein
LSRVEPLTVTVQCLSYRISSSIAKVDTFCKQEYLGNKHSIPPAASAWAIDSVTMLKLSLISVSKTTVFLPMTLLFVLFLGKKNHTLLKRRGLFTVNKNRNGQAQKAAAAHRATLQKLLEHRLEVARAKGDETLIRQLEQEASYLNLD